MKKFAQFFLVCLLIVLCYFFYNQYSIKESNTSSLEKEQLTPNNSVGKKNQNNIISNLSYEANLGLNRKYKITAETSEILYQESVEIINMGSVKAIFIKKNELPLMIMSDEATYNTTNYNTRFKKNVKITYDAHVINAENAFIDFNKKIILIKENVTYNAPMTKISADNIKIHLDSESIEIFMDNKIKDIKVELKK